MNSTPCKAWSRGSTGWLAPAALALLGVGLAVAQVTNPVTATNNPAELAGLTNLVTATNLVSPTNPVALTNLVAQPETDNANPSNYTSESASFAQMGAVPPTASPSSTNDMQRLDLASFRIITERNIFDPNRVPRSGGRNYSEPRVTRRSTRNESFSLVGTMNYEQGAVAFFDGTSFEYRKALKAADTIAGYTVVEIAHDRVKLMAKGKEIELRTGLQMRRDDEGGWLLSARDESSTGYTRPSTSETTASATVAAASTGGEATNATGGAESAPAASGASESDILKKLMERREQELNK